jgi:hypothetical protein
MRAVIIGAGPAGRAAAAVLPEARVVARPAETAWHAEPGRIWIEGGAGVAALDFDALLLAADEPLLLMALGCRFEDGRPVVDEAGQTTRPGIYAAGGILGAANADEAARQGAIAARALAGLPLNGRITAVPRLLPAGERLDPLAVAQLLEEPSGVDRNARALAQAALRGTRLTSLVAPARPVGFAALAAMAPATLASRGTQGDAGVLG